MSPIATLARPSAKRRLSPEELRAWRAFLRSHATVSRSLERELEGSDLTLAGYGVLVVLSEGPEQGLRLHEIAERIGLTKSGLSRLIDRLATRGYVERHACELDKRGQFAVVTPAGRRAFRRAAPGHLAAIAARFADHLTATDLATLTRALERVALANVATADPE